MDPHLSNTARPPAAPAAAALARLGAAPVLRPPPSGPLPASPGRPAGAVALLTWQVLLGDAALGDAPLGHAPLGHAPLGQTAPGRTTPGSSLPGDATLTGDTLQALDSLAQLRLVAPGQPVLRCGSPGVMLVAVHSGDVALGLRSADGVLHTERILRGPAWLDLSAAWLGQPHVVDVQALSAVSVLELPCATLRQCLPRLPALALCLLDALAREVRLLALNTQALMHKDALARLAQWLHARCVPLPAPLPALLPALPPALLPALQPASQPATQPGGGPAPQAGHANALVRLQERKRDLASQLAITPETLSRLMRSLSQAGVIEVCGYEVRVLDLAALARLAQS